jgi:hypothetical protein
MHRRVIILKEIQGLLFMVQFFLVPKKMNIKNDDEAKEEKQELKRKM